MTPDQSRLAFETWFIDKFPDAHFAHLRRAQDRDFYPTLWVDNCWRAWQARGKAEREAALKEAAQLADPEKYTCEDSCAVGKVRDAILALRSHTEIPARPSIAQQSGKLPDSPIKRDSLNGPETPAKLLAESQVRHSLDAASGGEWEGVNVQTLTEKLNAIIRKKPPEGAMNGDYKHGKRDGLHLAAELARGFDYENSLAHSVCGDIADAIEALVQPGTPTPQPGAGEETRGV